MMSFHRIDRCIAVQVQLVAKIFTEFINILFIILFPIFSNTHQIFFSKLIIYRLLTESYIQDGLSPISKFIYNSKNTRKTFKVSLPRWTSQNNYQ